MIGAMTSGFKAKLALFRAPPPQWLTGYDTLITILATGVTTGSVDTHLTPLDERMRAT
jgi:hypothetical protein